MRPSRQPLANLLILLVLAAAFFFKAQQNYVHQDYRNANFFSFWLAGRMVWTGESPYDAEQWLSGFDRAGATYRPSRILQYPLPLMYFMAPIGALPTGPGYFAWQLFTLAAVAVSVFLLLRRDPARCLLFVPIVLAMFFFGPVYLTLEIGAVGAWSLLAVAMAILLLEERSPLLAGLALSITLLKPPQALPLLALACIWLLARREWKAMFGLFLGALALLGVWLLRDPLGIEKFRGSSNFLLGHSLGVQSNVFGFAYLACNRSAACMWIAGSLALALILAIGAVFLWRYRHGLSAWEAFNLIIPLGFLCAPYLWSYDQLLYIIPIVWIVARLRERTHSYIAPFVFVVILDIVSFFALYLHASTQQDTWSILNTLLVLIPALWLLNRPARTLPLPQPAVSAP